MKFRLATVCVLLVAVMLFMGGCAKLGVEISELIVPPESTGELAEIRDALYEFTGKKEITLRYPKSGDWRSAFIVHDIDSDGINEAIAFYSTTSAENTNVMHVNLITKIEGKWLSVSDHAVECSSVESIAFENIGSSIAIEIIVRWKNASAPSDKLSVYRFDKGGLTQILYENCTEYIVGDIYSAQGNEIIIITDDFVAKQAYAKVFCEDMQDLHELGSCETDGQITAYYTPRISKLVDGTPAVFIDGKKGAVGTVTDVIYVDEQGVPQNLFADGTGENSKTLRVAATECYDFDENGALDVPLLKKLPGKRGETAENILYLTEWYGCSKKDGLVYKGASFVNPSDGYGIKIDEAWKNKLAVERSPDETERIFYAYDSGMSLATHELFRIKVLPAAATDSIEEYYSDFFRIAINSEVVVIGKINPKNNWGITEEKIIERFAFMK